MERMNSVGALPPAWLFAALASMMLLHLFVPVSTLITYPWNAAGLLPLTLGIVLNLGADRALKRHATAVKPFDEPTVLITSGVFSLSRNPMYLGMVLILAGAAVLLGSLTPFIIVPVFPVAIDRTFITAEEHMLDSRFGDRWKQYKASVRRWL